LAYDGSIKIDTKIDTGGFKTGIDKLKGLAKTGVSAITTTLAGIATTLGAGATAAATVGSSFEAAMSKVSAISGASGKDLQSLTDKAKEMGAKTKFSASESAEALQYMAMAGWDTTSMLNGIDGIMSLAAADGLDLATTSDIVTDAITAFGLKASDSTHFADVLAKASSSANTNVSMLGESFKYVAPLAGAMHYSVEDVSVALGLMANASVKGSMAGTSLKTALSNLASPTKEMKEVMDKYKISMTDANGKALPLIDVIKELRTKFSGLSETEQTAAASTLFGKEAMSGMLAIVNASDKDFNTLVKNIDNADGSAQKMADTMQNNLQGQITILKSGLEGLGIEIYESMSEPLTDAAKEAQNYVSRLTEAFTEGGLSEMIEEAGSIFGELATKAVEAAPKMIDAAMSFLQAFVNGIANNSNKLVKAAINIVKTLVKGISDRAPDLLSAAKSIVDALTKNLVKLLPKELQTPVKEAINTIKKSFENGGLKKAINTVKTILINLGKTITNIAKVVIPPLAKAIDLIADNLNILLPIVTTAITAWKAWKIISSITALVKSHAASVTAESLAEAASLGTITLKQIAVGALTGEITLATAAQYAWNMAMSLNPAVLILTGITALTAGIIAFSAANGDATQSTDDLASAEANLQSANDNLGSSYEDIGSKFGDFMSKIEGSGSIFDNFNESIIISDDEKQKLSENMDNVQSEITEICKTASENRKELTGGEIQRLEDLFAKMHELADQELAIEEAKQGVVTTQAKALNEASDLSLEEYTQRAQKLTNSAEETRTTVIDKAYEQYTEEVALLDLRLKTDSDYSQKEHDADVKAAEASYQQAVSAANKEAGDTLKIIKDGYYNRAEALKSTTEDLKGLNQDESDAEQRHKQKLIDIASNYNTELYKISNKNLTDTQKSLMAGTALRIKEKAEEEENARYSKELGEIRNKQGKALSDEKYQDQLVAFLSLMGLYEQYTGETDTKAKGINSAFLGAFDNLDEDTKQSFIDAMEGAETGLSEKQDSLYSKASEISGSVINIFKKMFDEHSPSKVFKKIFGYTLEGGENGLDAEAPKLYKQADTVASTFTERMQAGVSADGLVSKMRSAVSAGQAMLRSKFTADVNHNVELMSEDNERKYKLSGDIHTSINIDGRETAVALTPYVSEELAWEDR
jgi:TP901 family phage tail tape measure protein